jgi:hypothetical protein
MPKVIDNNTGELIEMTDPHYVTDANTGELVQIDLLEDADLPFVTASGDVIFNHHVFMDSDGVGWEDLRFPVTAINPPGAASDPTRDNTDGRLVFSASADNIIAIAAQLPHSWEPGSTIEPHLHWTPTASGTGNVVWKLQYKVSNIGETFPPSYTEDTIIAPVSGINYHQISGFDGIDMTDKRISCMILLLLSRVGTSEDDSYASTVKLNEFDIHYKINSIGSRQEYIK